MGSNLARLSPIRQKYSPWRLARTSSIGATLAAVVASPIFGQPADVNVARAAAILECNKLASPYLIYTWGNWQIYVYCRCMAKHGQIE